MNDRNADVLAVRWMDFRIGANLGDVIERDGDLLGDDGDALIRRDRLTNEMR
jgi:hypothetical protein